MKNTLKKAIATAAVLAVTATAASSEIYAQVMRITDIDRDAHILYLDDGFGNTWTYEEDDDWQIGDLTGAVMDDADTMLDYEDDIILSLWYAGNVPA